MSLPLSSCPAFRFFLRLAVLSSALGLLAGRVSARSQDAATIWHKSLTIGAETPMRADMTLVQRVNGKTTTTQAHIVQGGNGRYRLEYIAPEEADGRVVTSDGIAYWQYDPKPNTLTKTLQITGTGQGGRKTDPLIERNYKITLLSEHEMTAGRAAYLLELTPSHLGMSLQRRWIDRQTFKTLRIETRYPDGIVSRRIVYDKIVLPARLSAALFQPKRRANTRLIDASLPADNAPAKERVQQALNLGLKAEAPLGFQLLRITDSTIGGKPNSQLLYSDGIETISVFAQDGGQTPQVVPANWQRLFLQGLPAFHQRDGHTNTLVWSQNGHRYTAVSRISLDALQAFVSGQLRR